MATEMTVTVSGVVRACAELAGSNPVRWLALFEGTDDGVQVTARLDPEHFPGYETPEALQGETLRLQDAVAPVVGGVVTLVAGTEYVQQVGLDGRMVWEPTYTEEGIEA